MPTKNEMKFITGLRHKKKRLQERLFVAEGEKLVAHLQKILGKPRFIFCTSEFLFTGAEVISEADMARISSLVHPSPVLAVFNQPSFVMPPFSNNFTLILDGIRDPGNLGTMVRLCDWFGVPQIVCTDDCVDAFNEKVVQASMGSIASVQVITCTREAIISEAKSAGVSIIGTEMRANSLYKAEWPAKSAIIIGNEGQGISALLSAASNRFISIPASPNSNAESLNAAVSAAIILSEYSRRTAH